MIERHILEEYKITFDLSSLITKYQQKTNQVSIANELQKVHHMILINSKRWPKVKNLKKKPTKKIPAEKKTTKKKL